MNLSRIRHWLANADAAPARAARKTLRAAIRTRARVRSGTVSAEMDRIVETAKDTSIGSGLPVALDDRRAARSESRPR